jgi:S1-C subfamily serine protease
LRVNLVRKITLIGLFLIALSGLIYLVSTRENRVTSNSNNISINWAQKQLLNPKKIQLPVNNITSINQAVVAIKDDESSGSGVIIHPSGYVLTASHVVAGMNKNKMVLVFDGGKESRTLELVGYDECSDLALLKISEWKEETFAYVDIATAVPKLNDPITVFGYPQRTKDMTIAPGVISKTSDDTISNETGIKNPIKINELLGPGSSGGPIVNKSNQVVGISAIVTPPEFQGGPGLIDIESSLNSMLKQNFSAMGLDLFYSDELSEGVMIERVLANSPARKFGLESGDIITHINNEPITSSANKKYCGYMVDYSISNEPMSIQVVRENQTLTGTYPNQPLKVTNIFTPNEADDAPEQLEDSIENLENN